MDGQGSQGGGEGEVYYAGRPPVKRQRRDPVHEDEGMGERDVQGEAGGRVEVPLAWGQHMYIQ